MPKLCSSSTYLLCNNQEGVQKAWTSSFKNLLPLLNKYKGVEPVHRNIQINRNQNKLRAEARVRLLSKEGVRSQKKRCIEPESVFGQIKWNNGFKRFLMGGLDKVNLEFGLIVIAHNFRKWALA